MATLDPTAKKLQKKKTSEEKGQQCKLLNRVLLGLTFWLSNGKMVCTCAFPGCSNKAKSLSPFKFHRIPSKDVDLQKLWLTAMKRDVNTPPAALRRLRVCSAHFTDEDYTEVSANEKGQRFLKESAVPSIQVSLLTLLTTCFFSIRCVVDILGLVYTFI